MAERPIGGWRFLFDSFWLFLSDPKWLNLSDSGWSILSDANNSCHQQGNTFFKIHFFILLFYLNVKYPVSPQPIESRSAFQHSPLLFPKNPFTISTASGNPDADLLVSHFLYILSLSHSIPQGNFFSFSIAATEANSYKSHPCQTLAVWHGSVT